MAEVTRWDGEWLDVTVPTEDGRLALILFRRCPDWPAWRVEISDDLIQQAPQAIHAALGQALMAMHTTTQPLDP
jgi:hypothetical protein